MGIYNDGKIYGIQCYKILDEHTPLTEESCAPVFELKYDQTLNKDQIKDIKNLCDALGSGEYSFKYYTSCSDTYGSGTYMSWWPIEKDDLTKWLNE